jgi:predicted transcriptional regulator
MSSILIQVDEPTLQALDRVAPAAKRQRAEFIRQAIRAAIRAREFAKIKEGYLARPDSADDADDWGNADEFRM